MTASIRALDGSVLDFVTPAIGQAQQVMEFKQHWDVPIPDDWGLLSSMFAAWYGTIKRFRDNISFIKRRDEDNFCGYMYCWLSGNSLTVTVSIIPEYQGNGYARAAVITACEWAEGCDTLNMCTGIHNVAGKALLSSFGTPKEHARLDIVTMQIPISEVLVCES